MRRTAASTTATIAVAAALVAALVVALVAALGAAPAVAGSVSIRDARGDVRSPNDILRTKVINERRIGVVIKHRDLRRSAVDIQFGVRTANGTEWSVYATLDGRNTVLFDSHYNAQECTGIHVRRDLVENRTALSVPRSCLGDPRGKVRVSPRVQWSKDGSRGDWSVNGHHHWTRWVRR